MGFGPIHESYAGQVFVPPRPPRVSVAMLSFILRSRRPSAPATPNTASSEELGMPRSGPNFAFSALLINAETRLDLGADSVAKDRPREYSKLPRVAIPQARLSVVLSL
jgi:hypothetical protein